MALIFKQLKTWLGPAQAGSGLGAIQWLGSPKTVACPGSPWPWAGPLATLIGTVPNDTLHCCLLECHIEPVSANLAPRHTWHFSVVGNTKLLFPYLV